MTLDCPGGPPANIGYLPGGGKGVRIREGDVTKEAEVRGIKATKREMQAACRSQKIQGNGFSSKLTDGTQPCQSTFDLKNCKMMNLCRFIHCS